MITSPLVLKGSTHTSCCLKGPIHLQVGMVSTGFHSMKVRVVAEATSASDLEKNLSQENSTAEIAHRGLHSDEEEEECRSQVRQSSREPPDFGQTQ